MEIKKLKDLFEQIVSNIDSDPEKGYQFFRTEWLKLTYEEKEILKIFVLRYIFYNSNETNAFDEKQFFWIAINNEANSEEGDNHAKLVLTDKIKDIQIAKFFYDLKSFGYIDNTLEEIAQVLTKVFNLNFNTIFSYLNEPKRFEKVKRIF